MKSALAAVPNAAVAGRHERLAAADSLHLGTRGLREQAVADALAGGADRWVIGRVLRPHPQAAFDGVSQRRVTWSQRATRVGSGMSHYGLFACSGARCR